MGKIILEKEELIYKKEVLPKKIISLSDMHDDAKKIRLEKYKEVLKMIEKIEPSYICIPGDTLAFGAAEDTKNIEMLIKNLGSLAPTFLSLGNHFLQLNEVNQIITMNWYKNLEKFNRVHPLHNECYETEDAYFIGITSEVEIYMNKYKELWNKLFLDTVNKMDIKPLENKLSVLLCHSPLIAMNNNQELLKELKINLILSGHMHNGCTPDSIAKILDTFNFSKNKGLLSPYFTIFEDYSRGLINIDDNCYLHINKGFRKWTQESKIMNLIDNKYNSHLSSLYIKSKKLERK